MGYNDAVGGNAIQPSQIGYRDIILTATTNFSWPFANQDNADTVASLMTVTAQNTGFEFQLPNAMEVSPGNPLVFLNIGGNSFIVADNSGNSVQTIAPGGVYEIFLRDNSSVNGVWESFALGTGTSSPDAAALAGFGLVALASKLNQSHPVSTHSSSYELIATDRAQTVINIGGSVAWTTDTAENLGNNWFTLVKNGGSGIMTITPGDGLIDNQATQTLNQNDACFVVCDGTNFWTVGLGRSLTFVITRIVIEVGGNTDRALTVSEAAYNIIEFAGALTGDINVIVPTALGQWYMFNDTTGNFSLKVKTSSGTGIFIPTGNRLILLCDGTNVVKAETIDAPIPSIRHITAANTNITVDDNGVTFLVDTGKNLNLPFANTVENGFYVSFIVNNSAGSAITVTPQSGDGILPQNGVAGTLTLQPGFSVTLTSNGIDKWYNTFFFIPQNASPQFIQATGNNTALLIPMFNNSGVAGKFQIASGQTNTISAGGSLAVTFANAFASSVIGFSATALSASGTPINLTATVSNTQITIYNTSGINTTAGFIVTGI